MGAQSPARGDRVRITKDLGGYLTAGRIGIVWEIDPPNEDGGWGQFPLQVLVPWVRTDVPGGGAPWDGKLGDKSVFLGQFASGPAIPMHPSELQYIDNVLTNGGN